MNDLFSMSSSSGLVATTPLSEPIPGREAVRPGDRQRALSPKFVTLAARASKLEASEDFRDAFDHPNRTVNLMRALAGEFPDAWERCRAAELIDRCPARHLVEMVGSRLLAEKIADALGFSASHLSEH